MTRHLAPLLAAAVLVLAGVAAADRISRANPGEGVVWLVAAAPLATILRGMPDAPDVRVLGVSAGGRLVQLHVRSLRDTAQCRPPGGWLLRFPQGMLGWPGCG